MKPALILLQPDRHTKEWTVRLLVGMGLEHAVFAVMTVVKVIADLGSGFARKGMWRG